MQYKLSKIRSQSYDAVKQYGLHEHILQNRRLMFSVDMLTASIIGAVSKIVDAKPTQSNLLSFIGKGPEGLFIIKNVE